MRVALFTDTYLPDINGVVSSIELLRKKLEDYGHDAYVISTYSGLFKVKKEGKIIRLPGIELKKLYGYKAASPMHYLILEELADLNFDIIHVHTEFGVGIFAGTVAKHLHLPLVRTYHTTYEDYTHYANPLDIGVVDSLAKKAVAGISKQYGDNCQRLIAPSKKTYEMLKRYGISTPIEIIPTGVEIKQFDPKNADHNKIREIRKECGINDDEKMLIYVGRLAEEKSVDFLIETFKLLIAEKVKLIIVGSGPDEEKYKEMVSAENLDKKIVFLGKKPFIEIADYYHSADAFISASITETQGMTYIEALASGLIVFARYDEVLVDLIEEEKNGYFFNNKEEMADKIRNWLKNDSKVNKDMSEYALSCARKYDADLFVEHILDIYEQAINEYNSSYIVKNISLKNDFVELDLENSLEREKILVSLERFYELGIRKDDRLGANKYDELRKEENEIKFYRQCLKAIASRDYTIKEMYDYINNKSSLPIEQVNNIIDKLIERGLLDDRKYAQDKINSLSLVFASKRKIYDTLRKDGVPQEIIEDALNIDEDTEKQNCIRAAEKYHSSIHNKSILITKKTIMRKLLNAGFNYDDAVQAISLLDFSGEEYEENDLLKKEAEKAKRRLANKYKGSELRNRIFHALASKGFKTEAIYAVINEMEWDDE